MQLFVIISSTFPPSLLSFFVFILVISLGGRCLFFLLKALERERN